MANFRYSCILRRIICSMKKNKNNISPWETVQHVCFKLKLIVETNRFKTLYFSYPDGMDSGLNKIKRTSRLHYILQFQTQCQRAMPNKHTAIIHHMSDALYNTYGSLILIQALWERMKNFTKQNPSLKEESTMSWDKIKMIKMDIWLAREKKMIIMDNNSWGLFRKFGVIHVTILI